MAWRQLAWIQSSKIDQQTQGASASRFLFHPLLSFTRIYELFYEISTSFKVFNEHTSDNVEKWWMLKAEVKGS